MVETNSVPIPFIVLLFAANRPDSAGLIWGDAAYRKAVATRRNQLWVGEYFFG